MRELRNQAHIGDVFGAALNSKPVTGAMAEFQKETGLAGNEFSIRQLMDSERMEHRGVTPAPGNVESQQQPTVPYVFPQSVAAFLGIPHASCGRWGRHVPGDDQRTQRGNSGRERRHHGNHGGFFSAELAGSQAPLQAIVLSSVSEDRARFAGMEEILEAEFVYGADGRPRWGNRFRHERSCWAERL